MEKTKQWNILKILMDFQKNFLNPDKEFIKSVNKNPFYSFLHTNKNNNGNTDTEKPASTKTASE